MLILGIESSCDDTSVALVECSDQGHVLISEKTASQIDIHKKYGGVVPELAGRMHAEAIVPLIEEVLAGHQRPDAIAVTAGPGLITGLLVGVEAAQTLSYAWNIPLVAVNHISGHIHSVEIDSPINTTTTYSLPPTHLIQFPALALVVSGGHTELVLMSSHTECQILGRTKDDAAGECFDKVAKILGLEYPGGPKISKQAATGQVDAIDFPRPMLREPSYDFSFSGLKTSALYWLRDNVGKDATAYALPPTLLENFCASFEQAITDTLVGKTLRAIKEFKPKTVLLGGGVAANKKIRESLAQAISETTPYSILLTPSLPYCMDNGAMIAVAGYYQAKIGNFTPWGEIRVNPNWRVDQKMAT